MRPHYPALLPSQLEVAAARDKLCLTRLCPCSSEMRCARPGPCSARLESVSALYESDHHQRC